MRDLRPVRARLTNFVAAAAVVLTLAGCAGIPSSGTVTVGDDIAARDAGVEFFPLGPAKGASQEEVLRGFIAAASSSTDDYGVARQFLTHGLSGKWNPRAGAVVRTSTERVAASDAHTMTYSISAAAEINAAGTFRQLDSPSPLTLSFGFVQEKGQWRISSVADGIVLSDVVFQSTFDSHAIYFLDPSGTRLVPDLRWFPGSSASVRIVDALLDGPPKWLQGATRSAFPSGTRLSRPTVDVQNGIADVDLTTEALSASSAERQLMQAQLTASFARVSNVREVGISVGGTPVPTGGPTASTPTPNPRVDSRAIAGVKDSFGYLAGDTVTSIPVLGPNTVATDPVAATVSDDLSAAVTLGAGGVWVARSSSVAPLLIDERPGLVRPSLDTFRWVWSASADVPGSVRVIDFSGSEHDLPTGFSADSRIVSIAVSRDGARIVVQLQTPAGPRLVVRGITRDATANQRPRALSDAILDTTASSGTALDAAWVDDLSIATLVADGKDSDITLQEIGGRRTPLGTVAGATSISCGNGELGLRLLGLGGTVVVRGVSGWTDTGVVVGFIATQL